ncbi:hypothetical protein Pla110_29090 [Polystyrenella longa]|uniref:Uncharacterized protein n=1 Tax=Polystyrenella longa TaxID=2528007 RepID=A0A518CPM3_9PLAN|nr:hypothetical protein [Polystyrenella longa]QDU81171.1 hypothetical protein Pla110_29090 [Polystyrenella longa]
MERSLSCLCLVLLSLMLLPNLSAQEEPEPGPRYRPPAKVSSTQIEFELLTGARGQDVTARQWYDFFSDLMIPLRIRQTIGKEEPSITEEIRNGVRHIHIVGVVEINGDVKLTAGRAKQNEKEKFKTWIASLKEYGALGDPAGKPLWGLSEEQYAFVRLELSTNVKADLKKSNFAEGLSRIGLPAALPVVLTDETKNHLRNVDLREFQFPENLGGISLGSSLAIFLREFGLGFAPTRLPDGRIVLTIDPLEEDGTQWPVGWDWEGYPKQIAPSFYARTTVRVRDFTLNEFIEFIEKGTGIPIVIDHNNFRAIQLNPDDLKLTIRPDVTAWNLLLNKGLSPLRLRAERRIDETGKPFLWVGPTSTLIRQRMKLIEAGELEELNADSEEALQDVSKDDATIND